MKYVSLAGVAMIIGLSACDVPRTTSVPSQASPSAAEAACLRDVAAKTNNPNVVVLGSDFSEAGTDVRIGVGDGQAPWRCIAYSDGSTDGLESLTDEGVL